MANKKQNRCAPLISRREALGLGAAASLALAEKSWASSGSYSSVGLQSLGYVVVPGEDLDGWGLWAPKVLGLQLADRSATTRCFRMDDHLHRLSIDQKAQTHTFGWEVADAAALDAVAAQLETGGVRVARGLRALASQRGVRDLVTLNDPAGNVVEIFHGPALASSPFQPAWTMAGFRTGQLGMGHIAILVKPELFEATSKFYRGLLGFRLSDYTTIGNAHVVEFMHINQREHSLALIASPDGTNQLHHVMVEAMFMDDVGRAYDVVLKDYYKDISLTLGRHINDLMTSFYVRSPSGFLMECGWGGLLIDPEQWQAGEMTAGGNIWGHQLMQDGQPVADAFLPSSPNRALRAPLQVHGENFEMDRRATAQTQVLKTEPLR